MDKFKSSRLLVFFCMSASVLVCFLIAFVCYSFLKNDVKIENASDSIKINQPGLITNQAESEDYQKVLDQITKIKSEILDLNRYSKLILSQGNAKPKLSFNDLSELEKRVLIMELADGFTKKTSEMAKMWQAEIDTEQFKNDNYEKELFILRKDFAVQYETFVEQTFEQFNKEVSEKERVKTLNELKALHQKLGLIKR